MLEQHLGHRTFALNLRRAVEAVEFVTSEWIDIDYTPTEAWWERMPSGSVVAALRGRSEVDRGLRGLDPDVIVYNTQVPAVLGGRVARRRPYVLCLDDTPILKDSVADVYGVPSEGRGPVRWLKHRWNCEVFGGASALAPWSSWAAKSLVEDYGAAPDRIEVIPPGVDTGVWPVAEHTSTSGEPMRLLFVGGDFERKGGPMLLEALDRIPPGAVEAHIVTTADVAPRPGIVVHRGLRPGDAALAELYRSSDAFVLPSRFEMFGIAAVEAAAAGLPVILTSVGGLADLVQDGVTGLLIAPDETGQLVRAIELLAGAPETRRRFGRAAHERAVAEFDAEKNARRLLDLALDCIDRDGRQDGSSRSRDTDNGGRV